MAIKIIRVSGPQAIEVLPEIVPNLVFQSGEEGNRGLYTREFTQRMAQAPDATLVIIARKDQELVGFLIANLMQDCIYVSQTWSKPGNPFRVADEMFLRVMVWAVGHGRSVIRAETSRSPEAFYNRFGFTERSVNIERKIDGSILEDMLTTIRAVPHG